MQVRLLCYFCILLSPITLAAEVELFSPQNNVRMVFRLSENSQMQFDVTLNGEVVCAQSPLGVHFKNEKSGATTYKIIKTETTAFAEQYSMPHGKASVIDNQYNELKIALRDQHNRPLNIYFRAYDDGAAFRYEFPADKRRKSVEIVEEETAFKFASDATSYGLHLDSFQTPYEKEYTVAPLSSLSDTTLLGLPVLFRVQEDVWAAITEADLENYAGLYLAKSATQEFTLVSRLSRRKNQPIAVVSKTPCRSPWRVILLGNHPGRLVESNLVLNLNDPCQFETGWIKPGLAINDWTSDHTGANGVKGAVDSTTLKHYIDFCADFGLEYMSVDAGWYGDDWADTTLDVTRSKPEVNLPRLVKYAEERGVDVFVWTYGPLMKKQLARALPVFQQWGVKGLNIDFIESDDQASVEFVNRAIRLAAAHHLHVEFHGVYKPTGLSRTWPNLLSHEAVLGLEYAKWDTKPTPEHNCMLPFIRMLAGPLDYIVVGFSNATRESYKIIFDKFKTPGTRCHSLAQLVIFESGFQVLADFPDNYRGKIGADLLRRVPAAWDETRVLDGTVGDYILIARRSGDEWFVGGNTDWTPRDFTIPLDFLGEGSFMAEIYTDGPNAAINANDADFACRLVSATDSLDVHLAPGGGCVMRIYLFATD